LPGRENNVHHSAIQFNHALATVEMWDLRGHVQKVNRYIRLLLGKGRKEAENTLNL
jgi:hypothetical protein